MTACILLDDLSPADRAALADVAALNRRNPEPATYAALADVVNRAPAYLRPHPFAALIRMMPARMHDTLLTTPHLYDCVAHVMTSSCDHNV